MQTVALREIRSASRRPTTYWARLAAGGIAAAVIYSMILQAEVGFLSGHTLFMTAFTLAFALCLLEGVRQASTSIVEERVEGTLGLLLLTRVRGAELLLGKFAALAFFSTQTLLAITPVLAMSLLLGGVSGLEMARAALALLTTLIVTLTLGLVISANSREPSRAMIGTFFLLLIGSIILSLNYWPIVGWSGFIFQSINPMTPVWKISDGTYLQFKSEYWLSIAFIICASALLLWRTSRKLTSTFSFDAPQPKATQLPPVIQAPPRWGEAPAEPTQPPPSPTEITQQRACRTAQWFEGNPIEWLTLRHLGLRDRIYFPTIAALLIGMFTLMIHYWGILLNLLVFLIFGFLFSAASTLTLARARQTGEIELWLTTPLGIPNIIKGNLAVLRRAFVVPGVILLVSYAASSYVMFRPIFSGFGSSQGPNPTWTIIYVYGMTILAFGALLFALPHVGMWIALKAKTPAQATVRTFLLMIVCPWFVLFIPKFLLFIPAGLVASHSVRQGLKNFATRYRQ